MKKKLNRCRSTAHSSRDETETRRTPSIEPTSLRRPSDGLQVAALLVIALVSQISAQDVQAAENEKSWSSFTEISAGPSVISTKAIRRGDAGFTFGFAQGIRYNRFLFSLGFDGSYYIVEPQRAPLSRSLRIFDVKPSIGYLAPAGSLSVSIEAFYKLRQFRSNGIVAQTGDDPIQHGVGVASTIRYPATRSLFVALRPYYAVTVSTLSPVHEIGALFVFGFSATIDR